MTNATHPVRQDDYVRHIDSPLYPPPVAVAAAWYRARLLARDAA